MRPTIKYPPAHPVTIIPMATDTRCEPKTLPTTVGMVEKNPPFAIPLKMTKIAKDASDLEIGHITNMVMAFNNRQKNRVFKAPNRSQKRPHKARPIAEEKLNPANRPAPVADESPTDRLYNGRKNGGTNNGKVPTAPAINMIKNLESLNRDL